VSRPDAAAPQALPLVAPGPELTSAETERYSRHLLLPGIGSQGQRRLKNARVLVVGAGGLGSPAITYLAAAGVGTLGVVDDDVVELSNLQRQVVHGGDDLGRPKVDSAADAVARINPLVTVRRHHQRLTAATALALVGQYDLVLDGADNFATRYLVSDACTLAGVPEVWGSVLRFDGQVSVFWAGHGPTYRDLFPVPPAAGSVASCAEAGVLGAMCAAVGSVMAIEAVKLVTGAGLPLLGRLLVLDALAMTWRSVDVRPDPERREVAAVRDATPAGALPPADPADTLRAAELADLLAARSRGDVAFRLVDVRGPDEAAVVAIPGAELVPLAGLSAAAAGWPRQERVVLHCKSGGRSAQALLVLRDAGFTTAQHLEGGVLAWVAEVDPSLPRY
jgi:adenylyltransferase/sulfurtransferase